LFENAVEIGHVIKTAFVGYFPDGVGSVYQHPRYMAQPYVGQAFGKRIPGMYFDEPAEGCFGHIGYFGYFREADLFGEMIIHVLEYPFQPPAVVGNIFFHEGGVGQHFDIA
jgi:hypothetical protein